MSEDDPTPTIRDDQPWMIIQEKVELYGKNQAFVYCDRVQHLLVLNFQANKNAPISATSSTINVSEIPSTNNGRSTRTVNVQTVIYLERIQYIQRGGGGTARRSARNYNQLRIQQQSQTEQYDRGQKQLEIYYSTDSPRSEYLYKSISFQIKKTENDFEKWVNALYTVIDEAKNVSEARRENRWFLREYEKLRRSSKGLTIDSINSWLNSHIGLVGQRKNIEKEIKYNQSVHKTTEITYAIFKAVYNYFYDKQQQALIKILMSDSIGEQSISVDKLAERTTNNERKSITQTVDDIRRFLRLQNHEIEIRLDQCIDYLWSDANSVFDPNSRTKCFQDMNQPLNHYWISSSHNTYLAKTQLFNPASHHCYIQALLKGCRCVEIDVLDGRYNHEPEITHKNTRVKPILLREVLEAIHDYAFVASEYPVIISIENHCSPEQRFLMSRMFIEIFGENLLQEPLSSNETCLPSPNKLKRKILLKDTKINTVSLTGSQTSIDVEEQPDIPSPGIEGHVQLYDFARKQWLPYNYSFKDDDLFLAKDDDIQIQQNSNDDSSDDDDNVEVEGEEKTVSNDELTRIWYHGNLGHQEAVVLLLSNAAYEVGTFLVRKSVDKNCYCITFLAKDSDVKSIAIKETKTSDEKTFYYLSQKKFDTLSDLVSYYRTYDFAEIVDGSAKVVLYRLGRPLPRVTWRQELEKQQWYQPNLTRDQAEQLLLGLGEEMTFLIRESASRENQDYAISIYTNGGIRHSPIFRDGSDFMLMSKTFTSLIEMVTYFSRKPIFHKLTLKKPAKSYADFINAQRRSGEQKFNKNTMILKPLEPQITLKVDRLRECQIDKSSTDRTVRIELCVHEDEKKGHEGYWFKFDTPKDRNLFVTKLSPTPSLSSSSPASSSSLSSLSTNRSHDDNSSIMSSAEKLSAKATINSSMGFQAQMAIAELNKLIIYCQGVKLKELNVNKAQDLLEKIRSFKEMVSLNCSKGAQFCLDLDSMIQFNKGHFTRIYPDFSRKSWNSYNFEPHLYWLAGCQMVALNFQMPDRPMHISTGRFATNGGCGYVLMPDYIRSFETQKTKIGGLPISYKIRILAVRHLRTIQAKSILKVHVKTTVIKKPKAGENPTYTTIINGPCGIWDSKSSSKHHESSPTSNRLLFEDSDVDLLYFEIYTDNQEFCGQSTIPFSSLRSGIRSVQLYDRFNERLDMSALLVDIHS